MSSGVFPNRGPGQHGDGIDEPRSQTWSSSVLSGDVEHVSGVSLSTANTDLPCGHAVEWELAPVAVPPSLCVLAADFLFLGSGCSMFNCGAADMRRFVLPRLGIAPEEVDPIQNGLRNLGHSAKHETRQEEV